MSPGVATRVAIVPQVLLPIAALIVRLQLIGICKFTFPSRPSEVPINVLLLALVKATEVS
jgi:hypothetical protein